MDNSDRDFAKFQFEFWTETLGLKHTFSFDEMYDVALKKRENKEQFRANIMKVQENIENHPNGLTGEELEKVNPLKHSFADGCYIREIYNPANELIITKIHKKEHPFFLMKGEMSILTETGIQHIKAPYQGITKPGTKRAIYTHEECTFITVHATNNTAIKDVEDEVVCTKYEDLPPGVDALEILKQIKLKEE